MMANAYPNSASYPPPMEYQRQQEMYPNANLPPGSYGGPSQTAYIIMVDDPQGNDGQDDMDENTFGQSKFRDKSKRMWFVRKVLATVGAQLAFCSFFIALSWTILPMKTFFLSVYGLALGTACLLVWCMISCAIGCCGVGRGKPNFTNVTLLLLSTLLLSVFAASMVVQYDIPAILLAAATTVGVVGVLVLITFFTKIDITGYMLYIFGAFFAVIIFSFIASILFATNVISWGSGYIIQIVISGLFAVIFALMILYQLKLIVGGGKYQYEESDWLLASISLFYDVLIFFLQMLGLSRAVR